MQLFEECYVGRSHGIFSKTKIRTTELRILAASRIVDLFHIYCFQKNYSHDTILMSMATLCYKKPVQTFLIQKSFTFYWNIWKNFKFLERVLELFISFSRTFWAKPFYSRDPEKLFQNKSALHLPTEMWTNFCFDI